MDDLSELYQQVILDHNRRPRNFGKLDGATAKADGHNPICGDRVTVHVRIEGDRIAGVSFEGTGCAISKASASLMTGAVAGKPVNEAEDLFRRFQALVTGDPGAAAQAAELGSLAALGGVRAFPARIKCAILAWHALHAAVASNEGSISTE